MGNTANGAPKIIQFLRVPSVLSVPKPLAQHPRPSQGPTADAQMSTAHLLSPGATAGSRAISKPGFRAATMSLVWKLPGQTPQLEKEEALG